MISPYVRRQRIAVELRQLREAAQLTHADLAKRIGQSRMKITRLENGHTIRDGQAAVMKIIDALGVTGERWTEIMNVTRAEWVAFLAGARDGEFDLPTTTD